MTSKREITTANENATLAAVARPTWFLRMDFSSGVKRFHTGIGDRDAVHPVHGSETYTGAAEFGSVAKSVVESIGSDAKSISFKLSGVDTNEISDVITDDYFRRDVDLMLGLDDENGDLIDDPVLINTWLMDHATIALGKEFGEMNMQAESRALLMEVGSDWRFTDEDLQSAFSGDKAGEYFYRMLDLVIKWGGSNTNYRTGGGGGAGAGDGGGRLIQRQ